MKLKILVALSLLAAVLSGCSAPGQKFINIHYLGHPETIESQTIGLASFLDKRKDVEPGYVGYRSLMGDDRQTYYVFGKNLSKSLTHITKKYLEKKGMDVLIMEPWEPSIQGIEESGAETKQILTAAINRFECKAEKTGVATHMVLDIGLSFYLGQTGKVRLKTIPISLTLERTEIGFTPEKLEQFVSQSMTEVLEKALVL